MLIGFYVSVRTIHIKWTYLHPCVRKNNSCGCKKFTKGREESMPQLLVQKTPTIERGIFVKAKIGRQGCERDQHQ